MEICNLAGECANVSSRVTGIQNSRSFAVFKVLHQQFEPWAANLRIHANPKLSLDASVAYSESLRAPILQLLEIVLRNLLRGR